MIKLIQNLVKRNVWLVLVLIIVFAFMSLRVPERHVSKRSIQAMDDLYAKLNFDDLPFRVVTPEEVRPKEKVRHVAFLKVHKSGSTTAQNIFLRFGWEHNLTFVLPPAVNPFKYPNIISLRESLTINNTLPPPPGKHHELLCNHVFYNREAFRKFLPNDTVNVGILREPYEMFKSTLNYLRPNYIFKLKTPVAASEYLNNPLKYEPKNPKFSFTNNRMAVEFGASDDVIKTKDKAVLIKFIRELDEAFRVVIIVEYFEESIIMLRRVLNWSTKDILYLDKNIARNKNETALVGPFDRQKYKQWARIDYTLYEHFFRKLKEQVRAEGTDFDEELLHFREVRKMISEFCHGVYSPKGQFMQLSVEKSKWSEAFTVGLKDCKLLQKGEQGFVRDVRIRQYGSADI